MKPRVCLLAVLLVACSDDPLDVDFGDGPLFRTDASTYTITREGDLLEVTIPFTFENRLPQTVYLQRCRGLLNPVLERKVGGEWRAAWRLTDLCGSAGPLTLQSGAQYADTIRIHAHPFGGDREPQFTSGDVTGIHRLNWVDALRSYDISIVPPGEQLPLRHRVSNEFQLQGP
jgi:hypothetical protein